MKSSKTMNEKKKKWSQLKLKVNRIADKLGKKIDRRVRESIIALQALNFSTEASCEGHLSRGVPAPWIDVGERIPRSLIKRRDKEDPKTLRKLKALKEENLRGQMRLMRLLDEFYQTRRVTNDVRLVLHPRGIYGNARLVNAGERIQDIRSKEERREKLRQYRQEMDAFTDFLKNKYFMDSSLEP